jgi:hypothetical protein
MSKWRRILHRFIIINFLAEIFYGFYMVFFVVGGSKWPLMRRAVDTPMNIILRRRLYALESWVAMAGISIYLGITEILPWKLRTPDDFLNNK